MARGIVNLTRTKVNTSLPLPKAPSVTLKDRGRAVVSTEGETKEQAFKRLAESRVGRALYALDVIQNLASYPHSEKDAESIVAALLNKVGEINDSFREGGRRVVAPRFRLDS